MPRVCAASGVSRHLQREASARRRVFEESGYCDHPRSFGAESRTAKAAMKHHHILRARARNPAGAACLRSVAWRAITRPWRP